MAFARGLVVLALVVIVGVPLVLHRGERVDADAPVLVIITPHVQQIRDEFAAAFDLWHRRGWGTGVRIDWRVPGGTSDIRRQLDAVYLAAIARGEVVHRSRARQGDVVVGEFAHRPGFTAGYDLMFGGGTYDHGLRDGQGVPISGLVQGVRADFETEEGVRGLFMPLAVPLGFDEARLGAWFEGRTSIGVRPLCDAGGLWVGTALSSFGIVYNRGVFSRLGLEAPATFEDLTDPRLAGWVALADARQSGSIETVFESILNNAGWHDWPEDGAGMEAWLAKPKDGWRLLRELSANTRYFTNSSTKPPIDVSTGEAAAGLCIDFYGRGQAQSLLRPGQGPEEGPVGYVDPVGEVFIDPDPISMLLGAPNPELARRFVEFCLSEEGQALWQFRATGEDFGTRPGPARHELRRLPIRPVMFREHMGSLMDRVDPYAIAGAPPDRGWRSAIKPMMACFGIESAHELRGAWGALHRARAMPGFDAARLARMERLFYEFPSGARVRAEFEALFPGLLGRTNGEGRPLIPPEALLAFTPGNYRAVRGTWRDPFVLSRVEIVYTSIFRANYAEVVRLGP